LYLSNIKALFQFVFGLHSIYRISHIAVTITRSVTMIICELMPHPFTAHGPLFTVHRPRPPSASTVRVHYPPSTIHRPLSTVHYSPPTLPPHLSHSDHCSLTPIFRIVPIACSMRSYIASCSFKHVNELSST
jgi:hypothetical protein